MVFSSLVFLVIFLPIVWIIYRLMPEKAKNGFLLAASLFFYAWGEPRCVLIILLSVTINYFFALAMDKASGTYKRVLLIIAIIFNLALLGYFKYFNFFTSILNRVARSTLIPAQQIALPIGISFYTFQILSYLIDLCRGTIEVQRSWADLALYIAFFPQLIAGPIVRYNEINQQISNHPVDSAGTAEGIRRFCVGLGKKVLIANVLASSADRIYNLPMEQMSTPLAWTAAVFYMLQIYYDFSGYSDMAIGLARIFGFRFNENFLFPYTADSIRDFWRKWHISLSSWFREYVYIPLGGNRMGELRTYINLSIVFLLTGLWHGASVHFVFWGLFHGFFSILERLGTKYCPRTAKYLGKPALRPLRRIYTMLVVMIGWVFFRVPGLRASLDYIRLLFAGKAGVYWSVREFAAPQVLLTAAIGILLAGEFRTHLLCALAKRIRLTNETRLFLTSIGTVILLLFSLLKLVSNTYNPFIYFRF